MKEALLMEQAQLKVIGGPVDLNTAALTGARFDMKLFNRVTFIVIAAAGTAPDSHTISLQQHKLAAAGTPADLAIDNPWYHQIDAADKFTKVVPTAKASSFDIHALVDDEKFVAVFEVLAEDLNRDEDYRYVSLNLTDTNGAQLGTVLAIGHNAKEKPAYEKVV